MAMRQSTVGVRRAYLAVGPDVEDTASGVEDSRPSGTLSLSRSMLLIELCEDSGRVDRL
jgi:hypothetical protein